MLDKLLKKFHINIQQIINNSDNEMEDIRNEAYIVLYEHYSEILKDDRVFINELKKKCLKFNKYGKRIESKNRWEYFNQKELEMQEKSKQYEQMNEDNMCILIDIQNAIGKENYKFLLYYYSFGYKETAIRYNISPELVRKRVSLLLNKIRKEEGYETR